MNINGITSKALELSSQLREHLLDVVAFQETKLPASAAVRIKGYRWFGRNYVVSSGGLG
jgi:exonuclease III